MEWWFWIPDGSYSVLDIWDYIKYIIKKHETLTAISPIHFCTNRIYDKLLLKTKDEHMLELRTSETMKLFGSTESLDKTENGENVSWSQKRKWEKVLKYLKYF